MLAVAASAPHSRGLISGVSIPSRRTVKLPFPVLTLIVSPSTTAVILPRYCPAREGEFSSCSSSNSASALSLRPLLEDTPLRDVSESGQFDDGGFPGTFDSQRAEDKFDYALLSPRLFDRVEEGGTFRKGVFTGSERWEMFDTIEARTHQASDHAAVWARIEL